MSKHSLINAFSDNADADYEIRTVLGGAYSGAADVGEVLAAVESVKGKDHRGWFEAWLALGDRIAADADAAHGKGHAASASGAYLRASGYYAVAVNAASALDSENELLTTFRKHRAAWDGFVDTTTQARVERVAIPYEGATLPGYVFRPREASESTPLLIGTNGSDGSLTSMWTSCVFGALQRGYTVLLYDGPGQQSMLFEQKTTFRPDWEAVLTPVLDFALGLDGVDARRTAVYGISQGGYWVPRALAFEHRFAAAIADPGVVDVSASWTSHLPKSMLELIDKGENEKFDKDMVLGLKFQPQNAVTWAFRARPYGALGYAETIEEVLTYDLEKVAQQITTPLLITSPEGEQFWPGQSERLAKLTQDVSALVPFTAAEGADLHCQPLARALTDERMFDWLDERFAQVGSEDS
ncbi:S9 family peptidase [Humibacter sp. RRB41]|uniref:alpha/beta hydrolase family protein n=1 Tax=Humibacter sp. RRB41 TaxID=2919946 RepID=UPI001FAAC33D|nr:prolyl oligopeptidase family serine peptidase [Humibacter sp. RRB41]